MKSKIEFNNDLSTILKQLPEGALLTVKDGNCTNTMTIGWANFGVIWSRPIMMVAVRKSRYTHNLISKAKDFTVSFPIETDLSKELEYCGKHSGRDVDKVKECGLTYKESNKATSPIIKECDYHFECKILFSQPMDLNKLDSGIKNEYYADDDYHILYFGEIVDCY